MRYCPNCGASIEEGRTKCYRCGSSLPQTINDVHYQNPNINNYVQPNTKKKKGCLIPIIIVIAFFLMISIVLNYVRNDADKTMKDINKRIDNFYTTTTTMNADQILAYKNECVEYNYRDVLRTPEDYKGKKVYWLGKVQQVTSNGYMVYVNCQKNSYLKSGYVCDDPIFVVNKGNGNYVEDDVIKMWGTMSGNYTYLTVLHAEKTIPKFDAYIVELIN